MNTPFDNVIDLITTNGYHNHRKAEHSDTVSSGIWVDLLSHCTEISGDYNAERLAVG